MIGRTLVAVAPIPRSGYEEIVGASLPAFVLPGVLIATCVITMGALLTVANLRRRRRIAWHDMDDDEFRFMRGQLRRRLHTSVLVLLVGLVMLAGLFVDDAWHFVACWFGVCMAVLWMTISALMDVFWTRQYYGKLRLRQKAEGAYWRGELDSWRESHGEPGRRASQAAGDGARSGQESDSEASE